MFLIATNLFSFFHMCTFYSPWQIAIRFYPSPVISTQNSQALQENKVELHSMFPCLDNLDCWELIYWFWTVISQVHTVCACLYTNPYPIEYC